MKTLALSAGSFFLLSVAAFAEPIQLSDQQLDQVTGGSFVFDPTSRPALAGANPTGGQAGENGPLEISFGPNSTVHPTLSAWVTHTDASGFSPSQGKAGLHTPLDFGFDK